MKHTCLLTVLACLVSIAGCLQEVAPPVAPTAHTGGDGTPMQDAWREYVTLETVKPSEHPAFVATTGRVTFDEDHTQHVGAPVNGRVSKLRVALGDTVRPGQPLAELTSSDVAELQSNVKKSKQDLVLAEKEATRQRHLHEDGAVSDKEMAQADAELEKARAEVERGDAHLAMLGIGANDPVVRAALVARVAGTVIERHALLGQEVRADSDTPLFTISNLEQVWVVADMYEPDLGLVQPGSAARVRVPAYGDEIFMGTVTHISDVLDAQSRTVKVRCLVPNPKKRLKPEMFARVDLQAEDDGHAIYIAPSALVNDGDRVHVLTVTQNNTVRPRDIRVGREINGRARVLEGLHDGDVIVTHGAIYLDKAISE